MWRMGELSVYFLNTGSLPLSSINQVIPSILILTFPVPFPVLRKNLWVLLRTEKKHLNTP